MKKALKGGRYEIPESFTPSPSNHPDFGKCKKPGCERRLAILEAYIVPEEPGETHCTSLWADAEDIKFCPFCGTEQ